MLEHVVLGMKVKDIFDNIARLEGYRKPKVYSNKLKLDTNENIAMPKWLIDEALANSSADVRAYPSNYDSLIRELARYARVKKDCIAIGNGSDQIIDLLLASIAKDGIKSITIKPTFSFYTARCRLHSLALEEIPLDDDMDIDADAIIDSKADICYISSPNNPTGNQFDKQDMVRIIDNFDGLILIDEAYVEFADYSLKDIAVKRDNVVVLRTMSKAFGLAGLRIGYAIANQSLIDTFNNIIQYPYPLSSIAINAAIFMLKNKDKVLSIVNNVKRERRRVYDSINSLGLKAYRSDANFVMFNADKKIFNRLLRNGIIVKDLGFINGRYCLRVTVGDRKINDEFIDALRRCI